uniref:Phospholipid/glycerol acyltransferase domain-containing protein n=1 Tax=Panagrolaimus sp. JU765 TaxID=591449 RepID=A0AC34QN90_9BILA
MIVENQPTPTDASCLSDDAVQIAKRMSTSMRVKEDSPFLDFRKMMAFIGATYWFIMTVIIVPTACTFTYCLVAPILYINLNFFNKLVHSLCTLVNDHWVCAGQYTGLTITEYGDDISKLSKKRVLCLANHLGLIDHFCLMTAFYNKAPLSGNYLWVIFNIWKSTPLGVMWTAHGNFFINGGATKRASVLNKFRQHLRDYYWKHDFGWVVMYPEGSRLYLIRNSELKFAEKHGIEPFVNCAHPRSGAAHAVLDVCGPKDDSMKLARSGLGGPIEYIVDCTLGYPKGKVAGVGAAMLGEWPDSNPHVSIHYAVHKVRPEWSNDHVLKEWLYEQYDKKDKLLANFYKTGRFPGQPRTVQISLSRNIFVQLFWMAAFYAHYTLWVRPLFYLLLRSCGF